MRDMPKDPLIIQASGENWGTIMWEPPQKVQDDIRAMGTEAEELFKLATSGTLSRIALILHCMHLKGAQGWRSGVELEKLLTEFGNKEFL